MKPYFWFASNFNAKGPGKRFLSENVRGDRKFCVLWYIKYIFCFGWFSVWIHSSYIKYD